MTVTVGDMLYEGVAVAIRRLYIKRKLITGAYEADWVRVDNLNNDNIVDWGLVDNSTFGDPNETFDIATPSITMKFNNTLGFFSRENNQNSYWYNQFTYIRYLSMFKIECGYLVDGVEVGVSNTFEGLLTRINIEESGSVSITLNSKLNILTKYNMTDIVSPTGNLIFANSTCQDVLEAMLLQTKITDFIEVEIEDLDNNYVLKKEKLTGTYFDILKKILFISGSTLDLSDGKISIKNQSEGSVIYRFNGKGAINNNCNIISIKSYDDEGRDRVVIKFTDKESALYSQTTDRVNLYRYVGSEKTIDLSMVVSRGDISEILYRLIGRYEYPRPSVRFSTRFLCDFIKNGDKIKVVNKGQLLRDFVNKNYWNSNNWNDGSVWSATSGAILLSNALNWTVLSISNDLNSFTSEIYAEMIL